ncbi:MAG: putative DNA-binding domain-containing protein, partial [Rhizobiaceae bacterium]
MLRTTSQDAFALALLQPGSPIPSGIVTAWGEADAARFAVYRNNVFVGLTRALARRFPVTERLVGAAFFHGMARAYAQEHKPATPLMFAYGSDFPDFIAAFAPAASLAYLPDVAQLEAAWSDAYHAADAASLTPIELSALTPDQMETARLTPHPAVRLVRSDHPVGAIWAAHQDDEVARIRDWRAETVLITRPE